MQEIAGCLDLSISIRRASGVKVGKLDVISLVFQHGRNGSKAAGRFPDHGCKALESEKRSRRFWRCLVKIGAAIIFEAEAVPIAARRLARLGSKPAMRRA